MKTCISCNKEVTNDYIEFRCPGCGKTKIIRCMHCRETSKEYVCPDCKFVGP